MKIFKHSLYPLLFLMVSFVPLYGQIVDSTDLFNKISKVYSGYTIEDSRGSFGIDFDQDFLLDWIPNTNYDRNYTQGTAFSYSKYNLDESFLFFPLNIFNNIHFLSVKNGSIKKLPASVSLGVTAFTPREIADSLNPIIGDRPFANIVFLSTTKRYFNSKTKTLGTVSFSYGYIGSNIGNTFQSFAHQNIITGRPTNIGWQYQISNGGRPAFLFSHTATRAIINKSRKCNNSNWLETSLGYKLSIGWLTSIAANTTIKVGNFSKQNTMSQGIVNNLEFSQKSTEEINILRQNNNNIDFDKILEGYNKVKKRYIKKNFDWYLFANISPRVTAHNSFVLGQPNVKSIYTLPRENFNPFTLDSEFGIFISRVHTVKDVIVPLKSYDLILSINSRTSEIISKDASLKHPYQRTHSWGRITFRFPMF